MISIPPEKEEIQTTSNAESCSAILERLPELVNANAALVHRGRFLNVDFLVEIGDRPYHVSIESGRVQVVAGPVLMKSWRFAVRASEEAWRRFWMPIPQPGYHDLFAIAKRGEAHIEGDLHPFMSNLRYIKEVLAAPRALGGH